MDNTTLRLAAAAGLFAVGALLVVAVAALLDRRLKHAPPLKRPSPWLGLACLLVGAAGTLVEFAALRTQSEHMIISAIWGVLVVLGAIRLSRTVGWRSPGP